MAEMRSRFHEDLAEMEYDLLELGDLAGTAVQRAVQALVDNDEATALSVIAGDDRIDELYLRIDHGILSLLALQSHELHMRCAFLFSLGRGTGRTSR